MDAIMLATNVLTAGSTILLGALLYIYSKNLRKITSKFTIGLLVFAILFLVQNAISLFFYFTMMEYYVPAVQMHVFILTLLQAIAFGILLKITWE